MKHSVENLSVLIRRDLQQSLCVIQWFWRFQRCQSKFSFSVFRLLSRSDWWGPLGFTKTLKAKRTEQCDRKRGLQAGSVWFLYTQFDSARPSLLQCQLLCSLHAVFLQFIQDSGGEDANLSCMAITSHHDIGPTLLQCPSALTVKMSGAFFHLSEILSDLLYPSSSAEAPVCTGPCFI